ncbi:hypothetical protein [Apibacter sp. HY039]|uniref:hypothetical protein n=1 Tax=Apibacter sp. HY039 TaxID=2501476 RepID=UPI000FEB991A|nr:hypothetical protein [Apibacter sp. HY039]
MNKTFLLLIFTLFLSLFSYSQIINFKIISNDNQVYTGVTNKFEIYSDFKKINIPTENGKITLLSENLTDIYLWKEPTNVFRITRLTSKLYRTKKWISKSKNLWVVQTLSTPKLNLYEGGQLYTLKDSYLEIYSVGQKGLVGIKYFFKKPEEECMTYIGDNSMTLNPNIYLRLIAESYFSDCPELATKIRKREFQIQDKEKIIEYYNNQCE